MLSKDALYLLGGVLLGISGHYLVNRRSPLREPGWAKSIKDRITLVRKDHPDTRFDWEFLGVGGGGYGKYCKSANYACWRHFLDVDGKNARDLDAHVEIWISEDEADIRVEIYHWNVATYFDGMIMEESGSASSTIINLEQTSAGWAM